MHLEIIIVVLVTVPFCNMYAEGFSENEHRCYSRFDYEYKVVGKLNECETAHKKQKEMIAELKDALEIVKRTSDNLRRDVDILKGGPQGDTINFTCPLSRWQCQYQSCRQSQTQDESPLAHDLPLPRSPLTSELVAFTAFLDHTLNVQNDQTIVFNQVISNEGDGYDKRVGIFTCPKTGLYLVSFFIGVRGDGDFFASLVVNGEKRIEAVVEGIRSAQDLQGGNTILIKLNKGDTMWVQRYAGYGTTKLESYVGVRVSTFSGVLLNPVE